MGLNGTQRAILAAFIEPAIEIINELGNRDALYCFEKILNLNLNQQEIENLKKMQMLETINQIRNIFAHPYPQNRSQGNVMDPNLAAQYPGMVLIFQNNQVVIEPQGLLSLTAKNDDTAEPVTKEDVVGFIEEKINQETVRLRQIIAIFDLCINNDLVRLDDYIKNGGDPNLLGNQKLSLLHVASEISINSVIEYLLGHGAEIDIKSVLGVTPLHIATYKKRYNVIELLLNNDANINAIDNNGIPPLFIAAQNGVYKIVQLLLEHGAKVDIADKDGWLPIHVASQNGNKDIVQLFVQEKKVNPNSVTNDNITPLFIASQNDHLDLVNYLLANGAKVDIADKDDWLPIHIAVQEGHKDVVKSLVGHKPSIVNSVTKESGTPLFLASQEGHVEIVDYLLAHGGDINIASEDGWLPIHVAVQEGHKDVVKSVVEHNASIVNSVTKKYSTPLLLASEGGNIDIVDYLLAHGGDVNIADYRGMTPLCIAALKGNSKIVELLLDHGADMSKKVNIDGQEFDLEGVAKRFNNRDLMAIIERHKERLKSLRSDEEILLEKLQQKLIDSVKENNLDDLEKLISDNKELDLNVMDNGNSLLHIAIAKGFGGVAKLLIDNGINIEKQSGKRGTPLWFAAFCGRKEIVEMLLCKGADTRANCKHGNKEYSPAEIAQYRNNLDIVEMIEKMESSITVSETSISTDGSLKPDDTPPNSSNKSPEMSK